MRVLFLVPYPTEGPSNRYRVEQFLPYLKAEGIDYSIRPFISSAFFKILYKKGHVLKKIVFFLQSTVKRALDVINCHKYDVVFIHIESFPFGPAFIEWFLTKLRKPVVYDFEDAVYLPDFRGKNRFIKLLRYPKRFYQILSFSNQVIVCNKYMRDFVSRFKNGITVIPTSIDTQKFTLRDSSMQNQIPVIGWIGSHTTLYCLKQLEKVFIEIAKTHDFCLKVVGGGKDFSIPGVKVINEDWSLESDVGSFQSLDIGVYPLPSDERAMAKTPFKTIQYMSVGIPVVASRVGGNKEIIEDGKNSFLATTENEWIEKLVTLIKDENLRKSIGLAGRKTVEERYSVKVNAPRFIEVLKKAYKG